MYLCSLCNKEFPKGVGQCTLEHCIFCGNTSLEVIPAKIVKDPVFILMNTLLAIVVIYSYFNKDESSTGLLMIFFGMIYVVGMGLYLVERDKKPNYYCKNCRTVLKNVLTNVEIGEYENKPEKKEIIQSSIPKSHQLRDIIMIAGSVGSVISVIVIFMPK